MKLKLYSFILWMLFPLVMFSQDGYRFTLESNGGYDFTLAAEPNFDSGSYMPKTESYGFTLVVPDGITISINDIQPSGSTEIVTPIPGTSVTTFDASFADKDLFLITVLTNSGDLPNHIIDQSIPLVTFTVNGTPNTGELTLLANDSNLASNPTLMGSLDSFIQVDMIDNAEVIFTNGYLGQTGVTTIPFDTLDIKEFDSLNVQIIPNPASDFIRIVGSQISDITSVIVYDMNGRLVKSVSTNFELIDIQELKSAIYFVSLRSDKGSKMIKLVKE